MPDLGVPLDDLLWLAVLLAVGGALTGFLAGLFGIGGGGIIVPILYELFGVIGVDESVRIQLSVATSLAIIIPTSIRSFRSHHARGAVDMDVLRGWAAWILVGVLIGTLIAAMSPASLLRAVYAVVSFVMAVRMGFGGEKWRLADDLPGRAAQAVYATVIGTLSVLLGVGGGAMFSSVMVLYGRPIHQAVATASGLGVIISIPAAIGFVWSGWSVAGLPAGSLGYVNLIAVALVIPTSILMAPYGVRAAHALSRKHLERAFAVFLFAVSARFAWSLVG